MKSEPNRISERRFLAINFWVGSRDNGYLVGPVLVSTPDYHQFHLWDEPAVAILREDEYQIVKLYPRSLTYDAATKLFAADFPPGAASRSTAGRFAPDGIFRAAPGRHYALTA